MNFRKSYILIVLIAFGALVSSYGQSTVIPGNDVGVVIQGSVPQILQLDLDFPSTVTLDLVAGGLTELGTASLVSNLLGTYYVTVTSTRGGVLAGVTPGNTDTFPYTFNFGLDSADLSGGPYTLNTGGKTTKAGTPYTVSVFLVGTADLSELASADIYNDTLTFTISAN